MSEPSIVCNGHKENSVNKCPVNIINELFPFEKSNSESTKVAGNSSKDSMTIGTIPFPDFDHLYASSVEETGEANSMSMNVARSNLNSYHLNIIEEQAKIIDAQNSDIVKLKKQNESLIARIERMNRRLNLNQYDRRGNSRRGRRSSRKNNDEVDPLEQNENTFNCDSNNEVKNESGSLFPDDVPLINLAPFEEQNNFLKINAVCEGSNLDGLPETIKETAIQQNDSVQNESDAQVSNTLSSKSKFRIRFRRNNIAFNNRCQRRSKVVRFMEEKRGNCIPSPEKPKRICAKTIDDKLIAEDAVLFLKTLPDQSVQKRPLEENHVAEQEDEDVSAPKKKKSLKIPILTTSEPYFTSVKEDISHLYDPVTYTPTSLEVPSFRTIEKDNVETPDVPKDYYEDVTIEAAKERHLRFEVGERKRKKWDVQRIRELRQNERLKERLRKRKSRFNKIDPVQEPKPDVPESITTLFPDIRCIEKIIITDAVPVTALGVSIPKIPSWGSSFRTEWINDGTVDAKTYEDNHHTHHHFYHRESRSKPA